MNAENEASDQHLRRELSKMEYLDDSDQLEWDRVVTILTDITDGYLSNIDGVDYTHASDGGLFHMTSSPSKDEDIDPNRLGSRLLKSISQLHGIAIEHTIQGKDETEVLYRLGKFAPIVSKLSDRYAMEDRMYEVHFHDDIIRICDAISSANRPGKGESDGR